MTEKKKEVSQSLAKKETCIIRFIFLFPTLITVPSTKLRPNL